MAKTIGNPLSWTAQLFGLAGGHAAAVSEKLGGTRADTRIELRDLTTDDLRLALRKGVEDFAHFRADVIFIVLLYPVIGLVLAGFGLNLNLLPLLFPLAAGFALVGPLAAVGLYEMSRLREAGQPASWTDAFRLVARPVFPALVVMGAYLLGLFLVWMMAANWVYLLTLGPEPPASIGAFVSDVLTTPAGWAMIVLGFAVGFVFAAVALAISVVSFPLLLDREVGVPVAVATSVRVARRNPRVVATWGLIVAAALAVGAVPVFIGLILVMPILGHATWHLYRRAVV